MPVFYKQSNFSQIVSNKAKITILFWVLVFSFMYLVSVYPTNRTLKKNILFNTWSPRQSRRLQPEQIGLRNRADLGQRLEFPLMKILEFKKRIKFSQISSRIYIKCLFRNLNKSFQMVVKIVQFLEHILRLFTKQLQKFGIFWQT